MRWNIVTFVLFVPFCPEFLNCARLISLSVCHFLVFCFSQNICFPFLVSTFFLLFHRFSSQALSNPQYRGDVLISLLEAFGRSVCYLMPLPPSALASSSSSSSSQARVRWVYNSTKNSEYTKSSCIFTHTAHFVGRVSSRNIWKRCLKPFFHSCCCFI